MLRNGPGVFVGKILDLRDSRSCDKLAALSIIFNHLSVMNNAIKMLVFLKKNINHKMRRFLIVNSVIKGSFFMKNQIGTILTFVSKFHIRQKITI